VEQGDNQGRTPVANWDLQPGECSEELRRKKGKIKAYDYMDSLPESTSRRPGENVLPYSRVILLRKERNNERRKKTRKNSNSSQSRMRKWGGRVKSQKQSRQKLKARRGRFANQDSV